MDTWSAGVIDLDRFGNERAGRIRSTIDAMIVKLDAYRDERRDEGEVYGEVDEATARLRATLAGIVRAWVAS